MNGRLGKPSPKQGPEKLRQRGWHFKEGNSEGGNT
jgi:hypothetical protein